MKPEVAALVKSEEVTISPAQAAKALRCSPYRLNVLYDMEQLPFPAVKSGNRLKIIRVPFLRYLGIEGGT